MNLPERALFTALFSLSCAVAPAPQPPPAPAPPTCFIGVSANPPPAPPPAPGAAQEGTVGVGTIGRPIGPITVIPGQPNVRGAIDREDVRKTVSEHVHELATCPDTSGAPNPWHVGGRIVLDLVIDPQGRVERSSVRSSTLNDRKIDACVGEQTCRWTFPAPRDRVSAMAAFPLILHPTTR